MATNKKPIHSSSVIVITLIAVILCAGISALGLNLLGVSILAPSNSVLFVAGSAPQATPTTQNDDLPPTGFGTIPAPIPTFDVSQIDQLPTTVPPPELPTLVPDEPEVGEAPKSGKIEIIKPDGSWKEYYNSDVGGFSFRYPSNWQIEETVNPPPGDFFVNITLENYIIKGFPKGVDVKGTFKLAIYIDPEFEKYEDIDAWFAHYQETLKDPNEPASNPSFPDVQHVMIDDVPALQWSGTDNGGYKALAFGKGKWLYTVAGFSDTPENDALLDNIISSFRLP